MEKAIILSPSLINQKSTLELIKGAMVYLGDEFCIHKQPSFADFTSARKLTGATPVLLSTLLTEPALKSYAVLLSECAKKAPGTEVVVNDIGLLHFIDKNYRGRFSITLGRLITYLFDPKNTRVLGSKSERGLEGKKMKLWESSLEATPTPYIKKFLKRYAVERVETDSERIFKKYADNMDVKISFYYPMRLMAMTRFCPFRGGISLECKAPCGSRLLTLRTRHLDYPLFSKGNAYFVKNRLVKHPRLDRTVRFPFVKSNNLKMYINEGSLRG
ncbi:MAG: hypothetical protein A2270_09635 [Elusimicrobia bacterium RIFOXYA12_FULL_51_18]|nr:MAG: hypothetical protein A2270_09635 [Elusimicrobia bacterium RIFOXYA12_FULL_51_18]OGS32763.1 MAG: hypothetical protein A2218_11950 [Elusimicrobia bacterium RIFOXYA2_FULL_53_38]